MSAQNRLALDGGTPRLAIAQTPRPAATDHTRQHDEPPIGRVALWPQFTSHDDLEVLRAARAAAAERGRPVAKLERNWSSATGCASAIACASGSAAIRLAAAGLDIEPGMDAICPAGSPATAATVLAAGLNPVLADVDPETLHLDPLAIEAAITSRTRVIVAVDRWGTTADYRALSAVARRHALALIEDGSSSLGAHFDRRPVGSLGDASVCAIQTDSASLALGAGAIYATNDPAQADRARQLGLLDDPLEVELFDMAGPDGGWASALAEASAAALGGSMSDVDATIALSRLATLELDVAARGANGHHLRRRLETIPGISVPSITRGATHTYRSFPLLVVPDELGLPETTARALRDTLVDCMTAEGLWIDTPLTTQAAPGPFPVAESLEAGGLLLGRRRSPFDPPAGPDDMDRVSGCFEKILVDNIDRVRQLSLERANTSLMI